MRGSVRHAQTPPRGELESPKMFRAYESSILNPSFPQIPGHVWAKVRHGVDGAIVLTDGKLCPVCLFHVNGTFSNIVNRTDSNEFRHSDSRIHQSRRATLLFGWSILRFILRDRPPGSFHSPVPLKKSAIPNPASNKTCPDGWILREIQSTRETSRFYRGSSI